MNTIISQNWPGYELLSTGDGKRLERVGGKIIIRTDPTVLWPIPQPPTPEWEQATAVFDQGKWTPQDGPITWDVSWRDLTFSAKLTPFRHIGFFPEQVANWEWLDDRVKQLGKEGVRPKVLNLFGYTGVASVVAAKAGAEVCHVDASKGVVHWASENARRSGLAEDAIRWIVDDVRKFVGREIKRGKHYDIILMDPPAFGRGTKGEVWRLQEDLGELLADIAKLFSTDPKGFLLNFYATELYPEAVARLVQAYIPQVQGQLSELCLEEKEGKSPLQTGYIFRS